METSQGPVDGAAGPLVQARQGTLGREKLRGFGGQQVDLSIGQRVRLYEVLGLDFRTEVFNLFDIANLMGSTQNRSAGPAGLNP